MDNCAQNLSGSHDSITFDDADDEFMDENYVISPEDLRDQRFDIAEDLGNAARGKKV